MKEVIRNLWKLTLHLGYKFAPRKIISILERDWDYLIVLDACRYDDFAKINSIPGRLSRYYSNGSSTLEWLQKNFNRKCDDVVYFSANPKISNVMLRKYFGFSPFFKVIPIWKWCWNKHFNTVLPQSVNEIVLENLENFKDTRRIIHYMQPHHPFLTLPVKDKPLPYDYDDNSFVRRIKKRVFIGDIGIIWEKLRKKEIDVNTVRNAYRKNIEIVLKAVEKLLPYLDGKVVITSDHGNLFGEYFLYAHPYGIYVRPLVEVPWLEVEK